MISYKKQILIASLISSTSFLFGAFESPAEQKKAVAKLNAYQGERDFFLAYPRSGSTLARYCLEWLTGIPTCVIPIPNNQLIDQPVGWAVDFPVDLEKRPILKVHFRESMEKMGSLTENVGRLILIVRNPKEAISRHEQKPITYEMLQGSAAYYFDNLKIYDEWEPENRHLIYYEELLSNPRKVLSHLLAFLEEPDDRLPDFIANIVKHKNRALKLYGASHTFGHDHLYHSKHKSPEERRKIDQWIEILYPEMWNRYLKDRYSEDVLVYQK